MNSNLDKNESHINFLGTQKINTLLAKLSVPAIVAMLVGGLSNLIDAIFVGQGVGTYAIGGLAIVFPIQMLAMALAQLIGMGASSVISYSLGCRDYEKANQTGGNALSITFFIGLFIFIIGTIFMDPILIVFGATDRLLPYARDYFQVIIFGSFYFPLVLASNAMVRAEGKAKVAMLTMFIGPPVNVILDAIFIFGFDWGIKGAGLASIIGQFCSFIYLTIYFLSGKSSLSIKLKHLKIKLKPFKNIILMGSPSFFGQIGAIIVGLVVNNLLKYYGNDLMISVFGAINRIIMFTTMPIFGVAQGFQPIAGFNYGAKNWHRVKEVVKKSIFVTTFIGVIFFLLIMIFPAAFFQIFNNETEFVNSGIFPLRLIILTLPLFGIQIIGAIFFQAIGKAFPSLFLTISRQAMFLIPLMLLLSFLFRNNGIWIAYPITDFLSALLTIILLRKEIKVMKSANTF